MRIPAIGSTLLMALLLCLPSLPAHADSDPVTMLRRQGEVLVSQIYDAARWTARVPYDLALPYVVRLKLDPYLERLPLDAAVHERVLTHIHANDFVAEVIPFLQTVRDTYTAPDDAAARRFDPWLRKQFKAGDHIPGFTHSMFTWQPPAGKKADAGLKLDDRLAAQLITLYDALYLRDAPDRSLGDRLTCDVPPTDARLTTLLDRVQPIVRQILDETAAKLDPKGEMAPAIRRIVADPERLETVSITLIDEIREQICKHYRVFATRIFREAQLKDWLHKELDAPRGGALWTWLAYANGERRYAAHIVVDGLQGHLVEALAAGTPEGFLRQVRDDMQTGPTRPPAHEASRPAPAQATHFLERIATRGFHHASYLPFFRSLYASPRGIARGGLSTTPTISVRNIPIAETGAPVAGPDGTGLPNFHFVDRTYKVGGATQGRAYYFYGNDAVQLDPIARAHGMRTLFNRLPWLSSFNCAGSYDAGAHVTIDGFANLGVGESVRDFGETLCLPALERRAANERQLQTLRQQLLEMRPALTEDVPFYSIGQRLDQRAVRQLAERTLDQIAALEQDTLPEYLHYYNPWPDHFAHFKGPFSDEIIAPSGELNRLDYWLARLSAVYATAGVAQRTLFAMAGDHGLTPVFHMLNPEVAIFDGLKARGITVRLAKISSDEGEGPKLTNRLRPPSMRNLDVVIASTAGGNYMLDFFADHGSDWARQPLRDDLTHLRLLDHPEPIDMLTTIADSLRDSLDYLVVRETECTPKGGTIRLIGHRDGARSEGLIERRGERIRYRTNGADLLGLRTLSIYDPPSADDRREHAALLDRCVGSGDTEHWCTEAEWRRLASFTNRPDAVVQLAHLYDIDTAGTVNLFPRAGVGYNTIVPGRHAGEHFHEKDAFVGVWGAPAAGLLPEGRVPLAMNGAAAMAVYDFLSGRRAVQGRDGWGYPSITRAAEGDLR